MSLDKLKEDKTGTSLGYTVENIKEDDMNDYYMPMMEEDEKTGFVERNNYMDRI